MLAGVVVLALAIAEGKLLFYSYTRRDLEPTVQGLLWQERTRLAGRQVFMEEWTRADRFVLQYIVGARPRQAPTVSRFISDANRGDFIIRPHSDSDTPELVAVRKNRRHRLCRRVDEPAIARPSR